MNKTQIQRIIDWLLANKSARGMTPLDAFEMHPPITKLSTRIGEIERDGAKILKMWYESERARCMMYWLVSLEHYRPSADARLDTVQEQYAGVDDPWADAKHDAELARL
jgi:hypothetical protein